MALVVPAQTGHPSDPALWQAPPVPAHWWETIRATIHAYDPLTTPSRGVGVLPETVRTRPGARGTVRAAGRGTAVPAGGRGGPRRGPAAHAPPP
ncbi:hypothetical protein GCM10010293_10200 [Streptomyces griseoflavus]|nr:hypothetical protein GCM10010293_10200 [Streptomyces griseoflavus]